MKIFRILNSGFEVLVIHINYSHLAYIPTFKIFSATCCLSTIFAHFSILQLNIKTSNFRLNNFQICYICAEPGVWCENLETIKLK